MEKKMILINGEIISLENIWNISKVENKEERIIIINYEVNGKIIRYDLDYSDIKDDVNEEKTIIEKDYEYLVENLVNEWIKKEDVIKVIDLRDNEYNKLEEKYKDLQNNYKICQDLKDKYKNKILKIRSIIMNSFYSRRKQRKILEVIDE